MMMTKARRWCDECHQAVRVNGVECPLICASAQCDSYVCRNCYMTHLNLHELAGDEIYSTVVDSVERFWNTGRFSE
jgi:hypothetical protein